MSDMVPVRRGDRTPEVREGQIVEPWRRRELLGEFEDIWDRMVGRFFDWPATRWSEGWAPSVDVEETDDAWVFEVDLPGVSRDDIQIEVGDQELTISGEIKEKERVGVLRHRTRRTGSFRYRTTLPAGVDHDRIEAKIENGVLTVRVPRPEHAKPRRIKID